MSQTSGIPFKHAISRLMGHRHQMSISHMTNVISAALPLPEHCPVNQTPAAMSQPILPVVPAVAKCPVDGFLHTRYEGRMIPAFIAPDAIDALRNSWDTTADDIIICTHQKVGTHLTKKFVMEILRTAGVLNDAHPGAQGDIGKSAVPWPEVMVSQKGMSAFQDFLDSTAGQPRVFYTHGNIDELPVRFLHPETKIVMTYRDPKGAAVSQYHFYKNHPTLGVSEDMSMASFVKHFVEGDLYFGDYHAHVAGYFQPEAHGVRKEQVCVMRFEDLVEDKMQAVRQLAGFLVPTTILSEEQVFQVAASTEFNTMKQGIIKNPGSFHFNPNKFFRSGKTDDWKEQMSASCIDAINAKTEAQWGAPDAPGTNAAGGNGNFRNLAA